MSVSRHPLEWHPARAVEDCASELERPFKGSRSKFWQYLANRCVPDDSLAVSRWRPLVWTWSPGCSDVTPGPTSSTTPAPSSECRDWLGV